jgi:2-oxoglutarate ferredoxin oxidoreductase subunit alpha
MNYFNLNFIASIDKFIYLLILTIPIFLITGGFLPDLILSISSLTFLLICFKKDKWDFFLNKFSFFFFLFYFYLLLNSFFSVVSFTNSPALFYFRFGVFAIMLTYILSKYKNFGIKTFQAEDEIAAITSSIGASYGGSLGVTTTSGPGMALKAEAMGLAVMLEIPLLIINVQRGGPSTGLPTKTGQSDLLQAYYGRNGECPMPVISASTPSDCFAAVYEAVRISVQHMTPVIFLSDGYIANGAEPWKFPTAAELKEIKVSFASEKNENYSDANGKFQPYHRDEKLVRPWAIPGTAGLEHRVGGLEKQDLTGNISYDSDNHQHMVKTRQKKVDLIADYIPEQKLDSGAEKGKVLVLGWGSTYGAIKSACKELQQQGHAVSHAHLRYIRPFPKNLGQMLKNFDHVLVPEINNGQLVKIIRDVYFVDAKPYNKIMGVAITKGELIEEIKKML